MIVEKNSSNQPLKPPFNEPKVGDLLTAGQYEQAAEVIHRAQIATEHTANTDVSQLLAAARLMCLTAGQNYLEIEWHQWAAQEAEKRRIESIERLCELLERVDFLLSRQRRPATEPARMIVSNQAVQPSTNGVHLMPDHSVWRTIIKLLKRGMPASPTLSQPLSTRQAETLAAPEAPPTSQAKQRATNELVVYSLGAFQVYRNDELIENWPVVRVC